MQGFESLPVFGYYCCAAVYLLLLGAGSSVWRRRLVGSALVPAIGVQCLWAGALGLESSGTRLPFTLLVAGEYLHELAWGVVLVRSLTVRASVRSWRPASMLIAALAALSILAAVTPLVLQPAQRAILEDGIRRYWNWGALMLSLGGLILIEQVARNTRAAHEWRLRYVWLALGAIFACDACLYSVGLLHGGMLQTIWVARGYVNALLGLLLALGLSRIDGWRARAFLSPKIVFFNAMLLGAGLYVLAMAAVSFYVRRLGGSEGAVGQTVFLAAALLVLVAAALSEQLRARVRVTLAKHLLSYRHDYRSLWLTLTGALSASEESAHEQAARTLAGAVHCASFGLWLRDSAGSLAPMGGDLAPREQATQPADGPFFQFLRDREWIYDIERDGVDRAPLDLPTPPAWLSADSRARLIVPLVSRGALIGVLMLGQPLAETRLTWEEIDLLRAAGRQLGSHLALEEAASRLAEAREFEALNRLSAIILHDLRHLIAQQALVVQNAARHRGNPEFFEDAMLTIAHSVKRMTHLMEELSAGSRTPRSEQRIDVARICTDVVRRCSRSRPIPSLEVRDPGLEVMANPERMAHALEHVVRNAQDATPPEGAVSVTLRRGGAEAVIEIADTGAGMSTEFIRTRLFRPFDSTKGALGMGLGAYQAQEFARSCGGQLGVASSEGVGTRIVITLPLATPANTGGAIARELATP